MRKIFARSSLFYLLSLIALSIFLNLQSNQAIASEKKNIDTSDFTVATPKNATNKVSNTANEKKGPEKDSEKKRVASRGKMLYSNHCHACHESNVHIRAHRKVKKKSDIEYWVKRWSTHLKLNWNNSDREQVIEFLNQEYYKFSAID